MTAAVTDLTGEPLDGTVPVNPDWTGTGDTTGLDVGRTPLPAATRHVYTVTATFTVADDTTALRCAEGPGNGFGNRGAVTSGGVSAEDAACVDVPVRLVVDKTWDINGVEYAQGEQPPGFGAVATVDEQDAVWGEVVDGHAPGTSVVIGEAVTLPSAQCSSSAAGLGEVVLDRALVRVGVVNTVDCAGSLTVVKQVLSAFGGHAQASDWTVTATPVEGESISGAGTATGTVLPGSTWTLSESGGPAGWAQAGPWVCTDATGAGAVFGDSSVTVGYGSDITCVVTNTDYQVDLAIDLQHSVVGDPTDHDVTLTKDTAGQQYDYVMTVTNVGDRPATATTVTSELLDFLTVDPDSVRIDGVAVSLAGLRSGSRAMASVTPADWTVTLPGRAGNGAGGTFTAVAGTSFEPGEQVVFTFTVTVDALPAAADFTEVVEIARVGSLEPDANPADNVDDDLIPVIVQVLPTSQPPTTSTSATATTPTTTVTATTTTTSTPGVVRPPLAHTGFDPAGYLTWAMVLLLGGFGLVIAVRQRTRQQNRRH